MISRYEVVLNNVSMASLDPTILIHDVQYERPQYSRTKFQLANKSGSITGKTRKERAAVRVTFEIRAYETADRQAALSKIINWAKNGGDLRVNDRPGQRLLCVLDEYPSINSALKWTDELSLTFAAYDLPYWQSTTVATITDHYTGTASSVKQNTYKTYVLDVPGDAPFCYPDSIIINNWTSPAESALLYVDIKNVSREDGLLTVSTGPIPARTSGVIQMSYDDRQIQRFVCTYGTTTLNLQNRHTSISESFDVMLSCGQTNDLQISFTTRGYSSGVVMYTPVTCDIEIKWRGCWE